MTRRGSHVVAATLIALAAIAQPSQVWAQSGVLISVLDSRVDPDGLPDWEGTPGPAYRTLWITHDASGARHEATIRSLIVPRADGFWRVGITRVCEREETNDSDRDVLWAVPVGLTPVITQGTPCVPRTNPAPAMTYCGYSHQTIEFVAADLVAVASMSGQNEGCEPRGFHWHEAGTVRRLAAIETPIAFDTVGGPAAPRAYERAMRAAGKELRDDGFSCEDLSDDSDEYITRIGWSIRRREGAWRPRLRIQEHPFIATCVFEHEIQLRLPERVTGPDTLGVPWKTVLARVPDATDAFSSPAGDMAVVVTEGQLQIFELKRQALGRKLLTLNGGAPVLLQWALGTNVGRWTKSLGGIANQTLPAPRIR